MAEPLGGETSKEVSEPQKKRSLFRKPIIAQPTEDHEQDEGVGFFSRAKDLYPMRLAEEERKRQKKLEKTERKRSTASPERKTSKTPEVKRRRISSQADDHSSNSSSNDDRQGEPPRPRRASSLATPGGHRSRISQPKLQASPTSLSDRYTRSLSKKKVQNAKVISAQQDFISLLSESEDEDNDAPAVKKPTVQAIGTDDDDEYIFESDYNHAPAIEENDEPMFEEAFPELLQRAREREQKTTLERLNAEKLLVERNHASNGGSISVDDDIFELSNSANMDPVVNILITSYIEDTKPMIFRRKISQILKPVREGWCDKQIDGPEEYKNLVFLTWRSKKLYDITTCTMLGLKVDMVGNLSCSDDSLDDKGRLHLEAWTEELFRAHQKRLHQPAEEEEQEQQEEQEEVNKMKLLLKAKDAEPIRTKVRPTTLIQKLVKVVRSSHDIPDEKEVLLYFDGDLLDPNSTVEDADLGDMDIIEIRIR